MSILEAIHSVLVSLTHANPDYLKIAALVFIGGVICIILVDLALEIRSDPPLGAGVSQWARRYPPYPIILALVLGMLVAHIFWATRS
jgi:hypothetical protein